MKIEQQDILWPLLAMVMLVFLVWARLYVTRLRAVRRRRVKVQEFQLRTSPSVRQLPEEALAASDNFQNLFEAPVLFYVLALLLLLLHKVDGVHLVCAWMFVLLRYVHSGIHITYNRVLHRFYVYFLSSLALWTMWLRFAWQLLQP